jgi:hypothetical protein
VTAVRQGQREGVASITPLTGQGEPSAAGPFARDEGRCVSSTGGASALRSVGFSIDWLTVAFKVRLYASVRSSLDERLTLAEGNHGGVEWQVGGLRFLLRPTKNPRTFRFENADVRGMYQHDAPEGWTLELAVQWLYRAKHSLPEIDATLRRVASSFGMVIENRVRRVDLAADWQGFPLGADDGRKMIGARKGRSVDYVQLEAERRYWTEERLTGVTVCEGNPIMLRIYSKSLELSRPGRHHKREPMHDLWTREGWDGSEVTRTEFQLSREALDQLTMRDLGGLEERLDPAWQYCTQKWVRLIVPGTHSRRKNCDLAPRWQAMQRLVFNHTTVPATRVYKRKGATPDMVLGNGMSLLASRGSLERVPEVYSLETGELLDEYQGALVLDEATAQHRLRNRIRVHQLREGAEIFQHYLEKHGGAREALGRYNVKQNAAVARAASIDDDREIEDATLLHKALP